MLEKINKLIDISKDKNSKVYEGLISLAEKIKENITAIIAKKLSSALPSL